MPVGIRQLPNAAYVGGNTPGTNYLDKTAIAAASSRWIPGWS
ncbi:MAG: hypothetical protein WDO12_09345 [Pseudomonadota bacterium]